MKVEKIKAVYPKMLRPLIDNFLMFSHWWAISGILAILIYYHPTFYILAGWGTLFVLLLLKRKTLGISFILVFLLFFADVSIQNISRPLPMNRTKWSVTLKNIPEIDGDHLTVDFKTGQNNVIRGVYKIKSKQEKMRLTRRLKVGMTCKVKGALKKPDPPSNFHAFNYPAYLKHKNIHFLLEMSEITTCTDQTTTSLDRIKRIRQTGIALVNQHFPKPLNGITNALVFGERAYMSPEVLQAYQTLGLVHLLAVSGLHVGIVIGLCYFALLRVGFVKEHVHLILLLIIIPLYAILTGLSASVLRASLMIALALLSPLLRIKPPPILIVSTACLFLLMYDPDLLFDIGFQLSFLIAFAIILSARTIQKRYRNIFVRTFVMTGIAQTVAAPIIFFNFYSISFLSFFLNLFFIPFISIVILPLSIMSVLFMALLPSFAAFLVHVLSWLIIPAHNFLVICQQWPWFNIVIGRPSESGMLLLIIGVMITMILWEKWECVLSALLPIGFIIAVGLTHHFVQWVNPYGAVTFIDVGQGDSILIELPHRGGTMLIDTGGMLPFYKENWEKRRDPYDIGKDVVAPQIKAEGIKKINWLVLTHRDMDHIGGFEGFIEAIPVENIVISEQFQASKIEKEWFRLAKNREIHLQRVGVGTSWGNENLALKVIWPVKYEPTSNNRSLVIMARMGGENWLFTGDLEKEGEQALIVQHPDLHIDILKVGHHGSKTSSTKEFIQKIHPKLAVISVGKNNRFGHPHPSVLKTFHNQHIPILRTDEDGAVKVIFTKDHIISILHAKK